MNKEEKLISLLQQVIELEEALSKECYTVISDYHKASDEGNSDLRLALKKEYHKSTHKHNALEDWMLNHTRGMLDEIKEWNNKNQKSI